MEFTPDGRRLVSGAIDGELRLWDLATRQVLASVVGHKGRIRSVAISPDGSTVATGAQDRTARVWKLATLELLFQADHPHDVEAVAFNPVSEELGTGMRNGKVTIRDGATGEQLKQFNSDQYLLDMEFAPGGDRWAVTGGNAGSRIWNYQGDHAFYGHGGVSSWCVVFSPDGRYLATGSENEVAVWDLRLFPSYQSLMRGSDGVTCIAATPDGDHVLVGTDRGDVKVLELLSGQTVRTLTPHRV